MGDADTHPGRTAALVAMEERGDEVRHATREQIQRHGHAICCCWMSGCRSEDCTLNTEIVRRLHEGRSGD